ncbi:MAG: PmoA family protein [Verrucomicrobiales bacterium]|jgi:hypothetical protein
MHRTAQLVVTLLASLCLGKTFALELQETDKAITISDAGNTVLVYHKAEMPPPAGADPVYRRSGFVHPLCTPSGNIVTGIHPADHIHHMGLWHAWVKTVHGSRKPDFWNLKGKSGTLRYAKTLRKEKQPDQSVSFTVLQEFISLDNGTKPVVVLTEEFTLTAQKQDKAYLVDHTTVQTNITKTTLKLPAYRYGGPIAYRGPSHWNNTNSKVITSEGKTRANGHATRGRWCAFTGPSEHGNALVAILCHPKNHDAPQRMRIWPPDTHNGAVFFNYVPIQETSWQLKPEEPATMRYRLLVSDGKMDAARINALWEAFARQ